MRRGEHGGVLDQLGEQVDDVGHGVTVQRALQRRHQLDPRVVLDLGDRRAQHLGQRLRGGPLPPRVGATEHGEVLGVPPDAGDEVVGLEQAFEEVRILDLVLQVVEQLDRPVDEGLQPPGEVDEHLHVGAGYGHGRQDRRLNERHLGRVLRPEQGILQQRERVALHRGQSRRRTERRPFAPLQLLQQPVQLALALQGGGPQVFDHPIRRRGDPVGMEKGDDENDHAPCPGHRQRAGRGRRDRDGGRDEDRGDSARAQQRHRGGRNDGGPPQP